MEMLRGRKFDTDRKRRKVMTWSLGKYSEVLGSASAGRNIMGGDNPLEINPRRKPPKL